MKKRGIGAACVIYPMDPANKSSSTGVFVKINHDGSAVIYNGSTDLGQGSNTALMQIASETMGIDIRKIRFITSDTELTPYDEGTGASRATYIVGSAVKAACEDARRQLLNAASRVINFPDPSKLRCFEDNIYVKTFPEARVSIAEAAWASERQQGFPILGKATFGTMSTETDEETGHCRNFEKHVYGTHIAEIEVDTVTGQIDILRYVAVHDCGRAVNPMLLLGQIEGGISMGVGYALFEDMHEDPQTGRLLNNSFTDYLLPTSQDMPGQMVCDYVEYPDEEAPYGALGIGEATPCPVAPAIANALYDALGVRLYDLPLTPEKVLAALHGKQSGGMPEARQNGLNQRA